MDVLEAREQQLHKQLFGDNGAITSSGANTSITDKISDLNARLEHLYGAVAGFSRLHDMYTGVRKELELQPSSALGSSAPRAGEEIKRAVILSSEERIDEVVREFRKLKAMEGVLAQLEQLHSRNPMDEPQLQALERSTDLQTQRALVLHARMERVLAIYHEMIQTLSENGKPPCSAVAKQLLVSTDPFCNKHRKTTSCKQTECARRLSFMTQAAFHYDARMRRRHVKTRVRQLLGAAFVIVACCAGMIALFSRAFPSSNLSTSARTSGRLLAEFTDNSTASTSSKEGEDDSCAGLADWELNGGIVVYICALLYLFVALAIICDDYFVSALEKITDALGLSKDVAGATFMAAGSSAPELFVSLADNVFAKPEASLGIGTIVGSAIFNILIIIALSALLAGQHLVLDWRPLLRDSIWYTWAIIALTISVWDESVDVYESAMLFGSYACYIMYMSQNERVVNKCCKRPDDIEFSDDTESNKEAGELSAEDALAAQQAAAMVATAAAGAAPLKSQTSSGSRPWTIDVERVEKRAEGAAKLERKTSESSAQLRRAHSSAQDGDPRARFADASSKVNPIYQSKYRMFQYHPSMSRQSTQNSLEIGAGRTSSVDKTAVDASMATTVSSVPGVQEVDMHEEGQEQLGGYFDELFDVPESLAGKAWFVFTRPIVIIARLTIPDCRYPQFSGTCGFTATFIVAIVWIAFLSHYTVVWATKFGCIAGIPSALMGLTIIAAGTSIPDALSSILVARDGHGDMAVSNALGSNVFDILLGLGLPFFISNLVYGESVPIAGDDLELSIFILFGVLLMLVAMLIASKWRLRPLVGAFLLSLYVVYVVVTYLRGLGMI